MALISVSILNADLANLERIAETVERSGADLLHYDVMDGCFVDNISFGLPVLQCLRRCTKIPLDVHLMIRDPLRFAERFADAGAQLLSFHIESGSDPFETVREIHRCGMRAGIAVSPDTPVKRIYPCLTELLPDDFVLLMTVQPGWGSQPFLPSVLPKIRQLSAYLREQQMPLHIEVDGGINGETAALCREAGADYLVSGSYLFRADDPAEAVRSLRGLQPSAASTD